MSTVSIMPGIEARAPERTETSSGLPASPKRRADALLRRLERGFDLGLQIGRIGLAVGVEVGADLGGDGEAGRHRQAEIAHLGQVGALAAEEVLHLGPAFGPAVAEAVNPFASPSRQSYPSISEKSATRLSVSRICASSRRRLARNSVVVGIDGDLVEKIVDRAAQRRERRHRLGEILAP